MSSKMVSSHIRKHYPSILVVEGFWGTGKSGLIAEIRKSYPCVFIPEPNHIEYRIKNDISNWYRKEHRRRFELAKKYNRLGEHVVMERSIISSLAFYFASTGILPSWTGRELKKFSETNTQVIFLSKDKKATLRNSSYIQDKTVRMLISRDSGFYDRYLGFYKEILPTILATKILITDLTNNSGFEKAKRVVRNTLRSHRKNRTFLGERTDKCVSAVVMYKDKFLLLFDRNRNHFSLPQGHLEINETKVATAKREIEEETGFYDTEVLRPIGRYSYRYFVNKEVLKKAITVYLVNLKTLKRKGKKLGSHEKYDNCFLRYHDALRNLKWPEDKEALTRAWHHLNKKA